MTTPERLRRRRCIGLRVAVFFAVLLAAYNWRVWAIVGVAVAGALLALGAYWRDCRASATKSARSDTHARGS
jgi:O-antigen/teichoic acid export membrane protein